MVDPLLVDGVFHCEPRRGGRRRGREGQDFLRHCCRRPHNAQRQGNVWQSRCAFHLRVNESFNTFLFSHNFAAFLNRLPCPSLTEWPWSAAPYFIPTTVTFALPFSKPFVSYQKSMRRIFREPIAANLITRLSPPFAMFCRTSIFSGCPLS